MLRGYIGWAMLDKRRPAIVMDEHAEGVLVLVSGTSTEGRDVPHIVIDHRSRVGKAAGLSGPTYFYGHNVCSTVTIKFTSKVRCPPELFFELEAAIKAVSIQESDTAVIAPKTDTDPK